MIFDNINQSIFVLEAEKAAHNSGPIRMPLTNWDETNAVSTPQPSDNNLMVLQNILKHASLAKELSGDRLNDLINQGQQACAKVKDGCALADVDIQDLKGIILK